MRRPFFLLLSSLLPAITIALACGTPAPNATVAPFTGVTVPASAITQGFGCGTEAGEVYKYCVETIAGDDDASPRKSVSFPPTYFDCYADEAIVNVDPTEAGLTRFRMIVDVYTYADFVVDGGTDDAGANKPTWTTTCTATQQQNVAAVAQCDPLQRAR